MKVFKREFFVYLVLFFVLSIGMHFEAWTTYPIEHIKSLFGHVFPYHPLVYAFIAYVIVWFLRLVFEPLFKKKK